MHGRDLVLAVTMTSVFVATFWVHVIFGPCANASNSYETSRSNVSGIIEKGVARLEPLGSGQSRLAAQGP
jgi:hypothetical protein